MPKKRGKRGKRKPDPLNVQVRILVRKGMPADAETLRQVTEQFSSTGAVPDGYRVAAVNWQNPERKNGKDGWRTSDVPGESVERARETLNLAGWLRGAQSVVRKVGAGGGTGAPVPADAGRRRQEKPKRKNAVRRAANRKHHSKMGKVRPHKARLARGARNQGKASARRADRAPGVHGKRPAPRSSKPHAGRGAAKKKGS